MILLYILSVLLGLILLYVLFLGVCALLVNPEGTRSKTGQLLPFHSGVFKIAQKAEAPMAVLCITGTENISKRPLSNLPMFIWIYWKYFLPKI